MSQSTVPSVSQLPSTHDIPEAIRVAETWDVFHRPTDAGVFPRRVQQARRSLLQIEHELASRTASGAIQGDQASALEELRATRRQLRSIVSGIFDNLRGIARLPRVVFADGQEEPRPAVVAALYLRSGMGDISAPGFCAFLDALQAHDPLTLAELWNLPALLAFVLLEDVLADAAALLGAPDPATAISLSTRIKALRIVNLADWSSLLEPLIVFDKTLRKDPAQSYAAMDFTSRNLYRDRIARIARYSDCTESQVAQAALDLCLESDNEHYEDPRVRLRRKHIGYYLLDKGVPQLASRVGYHPPLTERARTSLRTHADDFYISGIQVITVFIIAIPMALPLTVSSLTACMIATLLLILPAMQCAVDLVNNLVTAIFDPTPLPKLDFGKNIPEDCSTLVVVPTLLLNDGQVRELVKDLEVRFLANRDPNLHYALLTDLPDSVSQPHARDSHPLVETAVELIGELNRKYVSARDGAFLLLHRHRIFSVRQGVWMGWERKRGKLLDLNKLLAGEYDAFPIKAGRLDVLGRVRFVLTLDSDTQLPRGSAARMIGAIAHPLHQAVIHPTQRTVVDGYGILQPRIGVSVQSSTRSRLAAIYSGQNGFDLYTRAISDAYQDLYGEGIFTGKGIYEVTTLHAVLNHRFPRNSLLSHDLIEGAYARAGLVTDTELIDDYPSHLNAYNRRKHRWVRGDWQIVPWMFSRVPDESGKMVRSPLSSLSRWQIFDNLRRSLVEPFTFLLLVAGWIGLPRGPLYWTAVSLALLVFPSIVQLGFALSRGMTHGKRGAASDAVNAFAKSLLVVLLNLVYLPHQTLLCLDAIVRALIRQFITGERLLEWVSAAQAELQSTGRTAIERNAIFAPLATCGLAALIYYASPYRAAIWVAAPILLLWAFADAVTAWLNAQPREQNKRIEASDEAYLMSHALRIWRYFRQFGGESHNYLIPDNVEERDVYEAARVSPTNLGLLLNARQAACAFGFLTVPEFAALTENSLNSIARLEKYRGHLYNWYDTQTLAPLDGAPFVSSVDSGNLAASLYTLHSGALELGELPLLAPQLFIGIRAFWQLLLSGREESTALAKLALPSLSAPAADWIGWLSGAVALLPANSSPSARAEYDNWWRNETVCRVNAIVALVSEHTPWLLPEFAPLRAMPELDISEKAYTLTANEAIGYAEQLQIRLEAASAVVEGNRASMALLEQLRFSLPAALEKLRGLTSTLRSIAQTSERLAAEMEFSFLAHPERHVLSVGYDVGGQKLLDACYDVIASEARIATFLAIARDDIPQQSWSKLSREHALAFGSFVLLSWSGTMFEYLMPALWMRSYAETLIARTLTACVQVQRAFAHSQRIPWGISESGYARTDDAGHYQYHAYGVPQIALRTDATSGTVISPYSTFLALSVDSLSALKNLRRMEDSGWTGAFGFYEAADYSETPREPQLVREWMAHHQGMSLLAILNLLHKNAVQRWFHANPLVQSAELLLHEMPVSNAVLKARLSD